jgi:chaperonin GroES
MKPLHDRIFVRRDASETMTSGGIAIPKTAEEKKLRGTVVAVGRGLVVEDGRLRETVLKAGEEVLFRDSAGEVVKIDGEELIQMREDDVQGVYRDGQFVPIFDRVVVKRDKPRASANLIIVPDAYKEKDILEYGVVQATGPGQYVQWKKSADLAPMRCKAGDHVLFQAKHKGAYHDLDKETVIVRDFDIIAIVEE